jgi:hypothetical protein
MYFSEKPSQIFLKMEVADSSEILVHIYQKIPAWRRVRIPPP